MVFSLCQAPTSIGYDSISPIITSLIEDSPQNRPTSVGMQFKRPRKIGIGKNRSHGAQALQFVKCLLAPVIPNSLLPACIVCQLMQGLGYLCELGDEPVIISHKPKKVSDFSDSGGHGPIFDGIYNSEGFSFSQDCSIFWNMVSILTRWLAGSFKKISMSFK